MKYMDDLGSDEICKVLDITLCNYWVLVHRAKLHLRKCLEKNWINIGSINYETINTELQKSYISNVGEGGRKTYFFSKVAVTCASPGVQYVPAV